MRFSMLLPTLLLLLPFTDAVVQLQKSVLFDEVDFRGVKEITTDICAKGCKVYATIAINADNTKITKNIIVNNPNTKMDISVGELSSLFLMATDNEKGYMEIGYAPVVTITNKNPNLESAPLALWIVSTESPYFRDAEVYEPALLARKKAPAPHPITILSAYPFTITVQPGDKNAVLARTTGFDAIDRNDANGCYTALDTDFSDGFDGLSLSINGPLLTLLFDATKYPNSKVEISGNTEFKFDRIIFPNQPIFISSPGFVCGSASSYQVYRSSDLNGRQQYSLTTPNDKDMKIAFDIDVVTDFTHPVTIVDLESQNDLGFYGNFKDKTNSVQLSMETNSVTISFAPGPGDSFFGMRVTADELGKTTSKTTTTEKNEEKSSTLTTPAVVVTTSSAGFYGLELPLLVLIAQMVA